MKGKKGIRRTLMALATLRFLRHRQGARRHSHR